MPILLLANTVVENTISVSAESGGVKNEQQASVHTEINGRVVEDWSTTSSDPINYSSVHTTTTSSSTTASVVTPEKAVLLDALLTRLHALIQLYVTLTNH